MSTPWIVIVVCLWLVVLGLVVVVGGVLRRIAVVLESQPVAVSGSRRVGPPHGERLRGLTVGRSDGGAAELVELAGPFVLAVLTSHCGPCLSIVEWLRDHPESLETAGTLIVLTDRNGRSVLDLDAITTVITDDAEQMFSALNIPGTPFAIVVNQDGTVDSSTILTGPSHLLQMLGASAAGHRQIQVQMAGQ